MRNKIVENQTVTLIFGISTIGGVIGLLVAIGLQHRQISALITTLRTVNDNPAVVSAIKGATEGVPQEAFDKALSLLSTARMFAPSEELRTLTDQITALLLRTDHNPANDPPPNPPPGQVG
jgi:hypothetical protein